MNLFKCFKSKDNFDLNNDPNFNNYKGAGCIFTDNNLILAGYHPFKKTPYISGIGGGKQKNETYIITALRELVEELLSVKITVETLSVDAKRLLVINWLKSVLNESDVIVFFLSNYNRSLKYLLEQYLGLNKQGIKRLLNCTGRATTFVKSYPNCVITEKEVFTTKYLNNC